MNALANARRVVVKVGSSLLVDRDQLRRDWLKSLCADIAGLVRDEVEIIVVSSGAIALGRRALKFHAGSLKLDESQAAAAVGQVQLAQAWVEAFAGEHLIAAQILLTLSDTEERRRYLNARATLRTLLSLKAVPVINENDTVATSEIRFGDNDRLAARVASMIEADRLVLLSDVDGLYTADPTRDASAQHVGEVAHVTPDVEAMAGESVSGVGRGGMRSKLMAAKIAIGAGCEVIIASGRIAHPLSRLAEGARFSRFLAQASPAASRKRWIAGGLQSKGVLSVDAGAVRALAEGKSLLPAGIRSVSGTFERGDAVAVCDEGGREIARGLVAYGARDAQLIAGRRSAEIEAILGYRGRDAMIHRDDLVLDAGFAG
ncbi:MAG: glutamate 5-kinase [Rhizomicrobium sp.]|jgi:glutamate 5-kinase